MKKIIVCTLVAGAVSLGLSAQVNASGYHTANLQKSKQLRASAIAMNKQASQLEYQIRCHSGKRNVNHLRQQAKHLRHKATSLAKLSNQLARSNFNRAQHRPQPARRPVQQVRRVAHQPVRHQVVRRVVHQRPVQQVVHRVVQQPVQQVVYQQAPQQSVRRAESGTGERVLRNIIAPVLFGLAVNNLRQHADRRAVRRVVRNQHHQRQANHVRHTHRVARHHQHRMAQHAMKASYYHNSHNGNRHNKLHW